MLPALQAIGLSAALHARQTQLTATLLNEDWMMPMPRTPRSQKRMNATAAVTAPRVTCSTPSQNFHSHQMLTKGMRMSHAVGIRAPRPFISDLLTTVQ